MTDRYCKTHLSGAGVGLRACHYQAILQNKPDIPWFEAVTDNYLIDGGPPLAYLRAIREHYPIALHGVGLSLGSTDPLSHDYLSRLKNLIHDIEPSLISDHLCWTSINQQHLHDLLPLPYTKETINHVSDRIQQVQDYLKRPLLIENISSYLDFNQSELSEGEFVNAVSKQSGCDILLDINNIYVNSFNHTFNAENYLNQIDKNRVKQFHLAGYENKKTFLFDSHADKVQVPVWKLYKSALSRFGTLPTLIEWDDNIPPLAVLQAEAQKAQDLIDAQQAMTC